MLGRAAGSGHRQLLRASGGSPGVAGPVRALRVYPRLVPGTFLARPNRFVARVRLRGKVVRCHVPDPGRLEELLVKGAKVLLAPADGPGRGTTHDLVLVRHAGVWVSCNSHIANRFVHHLLARRLLPEFRRYRRVEPEVQLADSRFDFRLQDGPSTCWLEVKSCNLVVDRQARFPDAPTLRGGRHLATLARARHHGDRACVLFIIGRPDASSFAPNAGTDPEFALALAVAAAKGVEILAYTVRFVQGTMRLGRKVQVALAPSAAP